MHSGIKNILEEVGDEITYEQMGGTRDFVTGTKTRTVSATHTLKAGIRGYSVRNTTNHIKQGDKEVRIAAEGLGFTPKQKDRVTINSDIYDVVAVDQVGHKGVAIMHILQVRGGING